MRRWLLLLPRQLRLRLRCLLSGGSYSTTQSLAMPCVCLLQLQPWRQLLCIQLLRLHLRILLVPPASNSASRMYRS